VSADLVANLESPLPASVPVGTATAVFCCGTCFHRRETVSGLEILVDGQRHRPDAAGMPRPDLYASEPRAFRSGFWGTVPVPARDRVGTVELALAARLSDGSEHVAPLGRIAIAQRQPAPRHVEALGADLIAVCMATYDPDLDLFRAQVESLRAQTDRRWLCLISDDCSSPERFAALNEVIAGDERFVLSRSERRLGFYRNFERALSMAPEEAQLLALCDQDDRWRPEKLEVLRQALGSAQLVYSDQRLVQADGRVRSETLWRDRRNNHTNLASLLVANSITGAASLFRREVAELALPFPDTPGLQFHDHWLGLVALAAGDIAYVDRPLYDYVQHAGAVFGEVSGGRARRGPRGPLRGGRGAYFLGHLPREVQAQTLLVRCAGRLTARKRRALRRYVASARSPAAFAWLAARPLRVLAGRNETLGSEIELVHGIVWRWVVAILAKAVRRPGRLPCDASFPDPLSFEQRRLRRWRAGA
jgi:glycosyltransferase involved in cell wall biosynthesis